MSIMDALAAWDGVRELASHPAVPVLAPLVWSLVQAVLDRPWWTPARRSTLVATAALVLTAVLCVAGAYPATWQTLLRIAGQFLGLAWVVYQVMATVRVGGVRLIDWIGIVTPGGDSRQAYQARHLAVPDPPPAPELPDPDGGYATPTWAPLHRDGRGEGAQ